MLIEVGLAVTRDITDLTLESIFIVPGASGRLPLVLFAFQMLIEVGLAVTRDVTNLTLERIFIVPDARGGK